MGLTKTDKKSGVRRNVLQEPDLSLIARTPTTHLCIGSGGEGGTLMFNIGGVGDGGRAVREVISPVIAPAPAGSEGLSLVTEVRK